MPLVAWSPKTQASRARARAAFVEVEVQVPRKRGTPNLAWTSLVDAFFTLRIRLSESLRSRRPAWPGAPGHEASASKVCGADRSRTDDIQLAKLALYQLSYSPITGVGGWWA
jgi:hypothetical protein